MPLDALKPKLRRRTRQRRRQAAKARASKSVATEASPERTLAKHHAKVDWEALSPTGFYFRSGRRLFDLGILLAVAPFALPIGFLIAVANALASGSVRDVFFVQPRVGHKGEIFKIIKFRTMSAAPKSDMESWSTGGDQMRVTRFGRLLRNSHLDELPQLLNVLRGEMHLIGPRPEMLEIEAWACDEVPGFSNRLALRPGITGYAQITQGYTGRDVEGYGRKLELCLEYQRHLSLCSDILIVFRTVAWMSRGRGWKWCQGSSENRTSAAA